MAEGIVYLDVDDEITSAASRIRSSPGTKVALVVPYGSRIATSRMNFRLLSREAVVSNRRLSIVSGDAASRSLAASAGLPVFGTVGEYESSLGEMRLAHQAETAPPAAPAPDDTPSSETIVAAVGPAAQSETIVEPPRSRKSQAPRRPAPSPGETEPTLGLTTAAAASATVAAAGAPTAGEAVPAAAVAGDPFAASSDPRAPDRPTLPSILPRGIRTPILAVAGVLALVVIVLAVGAYLLLPSASIALTPRRAPIGPLPLTIAADPDATAVDPVNLVVPADRLDVPVEAARSFDTTGVEVKETAANGSVTFTNYDTSSGVSIAKGSIISTEGGTRFATQDGLALQPAAVFPEFQPTSGSVAVVALKKGEGGNVPANTIRVVPQGQDPVLLRVNNPDPTSGGSHVETAQVSKAEVDKAVAALTTEIRRAFQDRVAEGANAPEGTTLFPDTAQLGPITPEGNPDDLVGQKVASFDLRLTATGTVIAVDPTPVRSIGEAQLASHVTAGRRLVPGSTQIDVGDGVVGEDGQVSFLATASAQEVTVVDADQVRQLVKGKTAAGAKAALASLGDASVMLWPDWVSTVTGVDSRLTVTVDETPAAEPSAGPSSSGRPARSPTPSVEPVGSSAGSAPPGGEDYPSASAP